MIKPSAEELTFPFVLQSQGYRIFPEPVTYIASWCPVRVAGPKVSMLPATCFRNCHGFSILMENNSVSPSGLSKSRNAAWWDTPQTILKVAHQLNGQPLRTLNQYVITVVLYEASIPSEQLYDIDLCQRITGKLSSL